MKIAFAPEAIDDLNKISSYYRKHASPNTREIMGLRLYETIARICRMPAGFKRVIGREGVRVAIVVPYHYKIFYKPEKSVVKILRIRHTSQRPLEGLNM